MLSLGNSQADPYILTDMRNFGRAYGHWDGSTRTQVSPVLIAERTIFAFVWGQSNSLDPTLSGTYTITNTTKLQNLNLFDGGVYRAVEPLLGGADSATGGLSFITQCFDAVISDNKADRVIIETVGVGASTSADWATGGYLNHRLSAGIARYRALGISPTRIFAINHQGESDNQAGTAQATYAASKANEIAFVQGLLSPNATFIAQATWFNGATSSGIRAAQSGLVNNTTIFSLGDFDTINATGRNADNTDYNATGTTSAAGIAKTQIEAYINAH